MSLEELDSSLRNYTCSSIAGHVRTIGEAIQALNQEGLPVFKKQSGIVRTRRSPDPSDCNDTYDSSDRPEQYLPDETSSLVFKFVRLPPKTRVL